MSLAPVFNINDPIGYLYGNQIARALSGNRPTMMDLYTGMENRMSGLGSTRIVNIPDNQQPYPFANYYNNIFSGNSNPYYGSSSYSNSNNTSNSGIFNGNLNFGNINGSYN